MGRSSKKPKQGHKRHTDHGLRGKTITRRQYSHITPAGTAASSRTVPPGRLANPTRDGRQQAPRPGKLKVPFQRHDHVLLVGEGDFSFTKALIRNHHVSKLTATSFDTRDELRSKYATVEQILAHLHQPDVPVNDLDHAQASPHGASLPTDRPPTPSAKLTVFHGIDATKLSTSHKATLRQHTPFDKIVFNFPHVGGLSTDVNRQVRANQQLLVSFFQSAVPLLATSDHPAKKQRSNRPSDVYLTDEDDEDEDDPMLRCPTHGQILVTLFEGEPYTLWNIRDLARHSGLVVLESFRFPWAAYPGYQHARTIGDITTGKDRSDQAQRRGAWRGEEREARTYILTRKGTEQTLSTAQKRKRNDHDHDDDDSD